MTTNTEDTLFIVGKGGSGNGFTNKTYFHTNFVTGGEFPRDIIAFYPLGYTAWITPIVSVDNDFSNIGFLQKLTNGYFTIWYGSYRHLTIPISFICQLKPYIQASAVNSQVIYSIDAPFYRGKGFYPIPTKFTFKVEGGTQFKVEVRLQEAPGQNNPYVLHFAVIGVLEAPVR
ncbi:MAG: hypothetical protein QXO40_00255 [Candidatus Aenigmatarchaeota archaeon]